MAISGGSSSFRDPQNFLGKGDPPVFIPLINSIDIFRMADWQDLIDNHIRDMITVEYRTDVAGTWRNDCFPYSLSRAAWKDLLVQLKINFVGLTRRQISKRAKD